MSVKYYTNNNLTDVSDMLLKTTGSEYYQEVNCTAAEYAVISPHNPHTIYVVTQPDGTIVKYLGDEEIGYDKYYTIERAAIVKEEDAETMIVEHEVVNVDVVSGTTAIYGNARNKFIAGGHRVILADTAEAAANELAREDIYGAGVQWDVRTVTAVTINSISFVGSGDNKKKRYTITISFAQGISAYVANIDVPTDNILITFGCVYVANGLNQTSGYCTGGIGVGAIDNQGNKYCVLSTTNAHRPNITMTVNEFNFAFGMTERYEVVES